MKTTILVRASLVLAASFVVTACGSKDPPAQQPQPFYGQPGQPGDPNAQYQQQPQYGAPQPGQPVQPGQPAQPYQQPGQPYPQPGQPYPQAGTPPQTTGPAAAPPAAPAGSDPATAAAVRLALQPRAGTEAKGMKEDGDAIGGMMQEGGTLTQEFMLMPGKCYTVLAQGLPPIAELDLSLAAKPLVPALPPAVLATDQTSGAAASIAPGKNCYKNPFPVAAAVVLTLKATRGSGPAGAQVYSK